MVNSRTKGHSYEREIVNLLREELGTIVDEPIKRILDQYRQNNLPDIVVGPFAIECKRYNRGCAPHQAWWDQVVAAGEANNLIPALVYRFDRAKTLCVLPLHAINSDYPKSTESRVTLEWNDFVMVMRETLASP